MNRIASQRPGNPSHLLIHALSPARHSPLLELVRRIDDCGCALADAQVSTVGSDASVMLLAQGGWDAVAKLETALGRMGHDEALHLVYYRTEPRSAQTHLMPYVVELIAADRNGLLLEVVEFFSRRGIRIEQLGSMRYQAMHTGADMFQSQITIGIPADSHLAALRDDFMELCDSLNLDAVMDPVKF